MDSGFDSVWAADHVIQQPPGGGPGAPALEPYTLLAALAALTRRVRLGALVSPVTFRNPALLAKTVTTLDVISGGRAVLGLGAGWIAAEHAAYGLPFPPVAERQDRLEEAAQVCRAMLTRTAPRAPVTFTGRYYQVSQAPCEPPPAQDRVPLLIGGSGEQRTVRAVARYADACNTRGDAPGRRARINELRIELARIPDQGYAVDVRQYRPAVAAIGAAVPGPHGTPVAGICISMPDSCFDADRIPEWGRHAS